ncbi:hypothetical protein GCM10010276_66860 [Streptomyces longisporus]|uniref:Uncharacterized protein n=1 Tax=Streptomyces longisporus TaxID=1948 RepID=A0ABP6A5B6_STRLO
MNDLGWGRSGGSGGNSGNKGSGGGQGPGGSVCGAHEDGVYGGHGSGPEGSRKAFGGRMRGVR